MRSVARSRRLDILTSGDSAGVAGLRAGLCRLTKPSGRRSRGVRRRSRLLLHRLLGVVVPPVVALH